MAQLDKSQINTILEAIAKLLATSTSMSQDDLMSSIMAKMWIHQSQKDSFTKQASADALEVLLNNDSPEKLDQEKKYWYKLLQETDRGLKLLQQKDINQITFKEDYRILLGLENNLKVIQSKGDIPSHLFVDKSFIYDPHYPEAFDYIITLRPLLREYSYDLKKKEEKRANKNISLIINNSKNRETTVNAQLYNYKKSYYTINEDKYIDLMANEVFHDTEYDVEL